MRVRPRRLERLLSLHSPHQAAAAAHSIAAASNGVELSGNYAVTDFGRGPNTSAERKDAICAMICLTCRAVFE